MGSMNPLNETQCNGDKVTDGLISTENGKCDTQLEYDGGKGWSKIKKRVTVLASVKAIKEEPVKKRKKNEDNLGVVFMGIITIFIGM